jgi:cellulose synthase/poly-beta-1,6-N-acetylglucosamine synthase-like glycosyltransferase
MLLAQTTTQPVNDLLTKLPDATTFTGGMYVAYVTLLAIYVLTLVLLSCYGFHRYVLVYLYYKYKNNAPKPKTFFQDLPKICIQLPMFNEQFVAKRIIEHTCQIDYPKDKLDIQVLDDSTDSTVEIARETVEHFKQQGFNITYIHRDDRTGFKAGALSNGLKFTDANFVAIFDADFIPPKDILNNTIQYFTDSKVGMIQSRWEHLNRDHSLLTQSQAILLDGHFMIEHTARNRSGRFMSFNGTAGMWRRQCIEEAGGWQHDTLTEDLDLSYRAQLKGWKFLFLPQIVSPAELPPEINAFKQQQHRWTKGGAQTAKKLLPKIFASPVNWRIKAEAFFHLTSCTCYIYIVMLTLMLFPVLYFRLTVFPNSGISRFVFDVSLFLLATCSASAFYMASQREIFRHWHDKIKYLPFLMALGIGISISNTIAALEGFFGKCGEFVRTPKFGVETSQDQKWKQKMGTIHIKKSLVPFIELGFGIYMLGCISMCLHFGTAPMSVPFLVLFALGYFYVSFSSFYLQYQMNQQAKRYNEQLELESANVGTNGQEILPAVENAAVTIPSNAQAKMNEVKKV